MPETDRQTCRTAILQALQSGPMARRDLVKLMPAKRIMTPSTCRYLIDAMVRTGELLQEKREGYIWVRVACK